MMMNQRPIRDACQVTTMQVFAIGLVAGLASAFVILLSQIFGFTSIDLNMFFGSFWTSEVGPQSRWIGFLIHLCLSALIAQAYAFLFRSAHRSGAGVGVTIGVIHWVVAGIGTGLTAGLHPLIPGQILSPGLFVLGDGFGGVATYFAAHMSYAAMVGFIFDRVAMCDEFPLPMHAS
jgi:hypothetical protein